MVEILIYNPSIWVPPTGSQQGNTAIYLRKRLGTKSWLGKQRCIRNASDTPPATEANTRLLLHQRRSERDAFLSPSHNKLLSAGKRTIYKPCLVRSKIMESSLFPTEDSSSGPGFIQLLPEHPEHRSVVKAQLPADFFPQILSFITPAVMP